MTKHQETKEVAIKSVAGVPEFLADLLKADAGKGVSSAQEDNLTPLIYILQSNSPTAQKRSPEYIEGAEPGSIWLRNSPDPIVAGEEGIIFQPCFFEKEWVEWIVRDDGGGYVGRYDELPEVAESKPDPKNPNRTRYLMPNGHEMIETRKHSGFVIRESGLVMPYTIPFTSSGHTVSRQWMSMMKFKQMPGVGSAASWASYYRLRTKQRSNAAGTWFVFDVSDAGWVPTKDDYSRGKALHEAFSSGSRKSEAPVHDTKEPTGDEVPF